MEGQGATLGNSVNAAAAAAKGREVSLAEADRFASQVLPTIKSLQQSGVTRLRQLASAAACSGIGRPDEAVVTGASGRASPCEE
jgi:hypothetical protein